MNAIEIEEAISALFDKPCEPETFPAEFLEAFGNKTTTIKRLQSAASLSDVDGAVLLRNNIHLKVCTEGLVGSVFNQLKISPTTTKNKVKFILVTDGTTVEAEDLSGDAPLVCEYADFPNHFGYFLPLAGIETVKQIRDSSFDIRATSRLNKLYVELLKDNPDWGASENRHEMNHFMARLIFCFFAEDTDIFRGNRLFTTTIEQMSDRDSSNTHQVIGEIFRAMDAKIELRPEARLPRWAETFPYVNGGLFSGSIKVPKFSKISRSYLLHIGSLDWTKINPDIFGSMIQAVADDEERSELGMHYTSVPNILKVLNPLFLDELRQQLELAGDNARTLLNLRKRISRIRVFDPACGSGNFLVIAYKQLRELENVINERRGEFGRQSEIPLTNFRGIEIRDFSAEIARLALIIAEYQCDLFYRGQKEALAVFLPLDSHNWITCGNALRIDWLSLCPPTGTAIKLTGDDLFDVPLDQAEIDFKNEGGETYICGNPPYKGNAKKSADQKLDMSNLFNKKIDGWGLFDYVCCWFFKAHEYAKHTQTKFAFVATNSVTQGQHVTGFWRLLFEDGLKFNFAVRSFKWKNLAANDAGVIVVCIGAGTPAPNVEIYDEDKKISTKNINAYLMAADDYWITPSSTPISDIQTMQKGNYYGMSEYLIFDSVRAAEYLKDGLGASYIKKFYGSSEVIKARPRACFWFPEEPPVKVLSIADIKERINQVESARQNSKDAVSNGMVKRPHQFREMRSCKNSFLAIPVVSSENRSYLPVDLLDNQSVISNKCFALYDAPLWSMAIIASRLHWAWIGTVCVRLGMSFSYSNTLGWNTFPVPRLTEKNKADLTKCAEDILLARESHFPSSIADLYEQELMPQNLLDAHNHNDEVLERIYIGRQFKNDTERLEKLFEMYAKMTSKK